MKCFMSKEYKVLEKSELFDAKWYLETYPDVETAKMDPLVHYLDFGWREGRKPSERFDGDVYFELNPDVKAAQINPLLHYEIYGAKEGRKFTKSSPQQVKEVLFDSIKKNIISTDAIKAIIDNPEIKVVSFDIFDTLLVRPVVEPTDVFYLIEKKIQSEHKLGFVKYRLSAEREMKNNTVSLDDIYDFIQKKYKLSSQDCLVMKQAVLDAEKQLLTPRADIQQVYEYAVQLSKKIIAVSDSCYSVDFLKKVLDKNGYTSISKIYLSHEYKASKRVGDIYEIVKEKEGTEEICHIGANKEFDCIMALKSGLTALYYPSVKDLVFSEKSIYRDVWNEPSKDPMARILLGYTLNKCFGNLASLSDSPRVFSDFAHFVSLGLSPALFQLMLTLGIRSSVQVEEDSLIKRAFDIYTKYKKIIPSGCANTDAKAQGVASSKYFDMILEVLNQNANFEGDVSLRFVEDACVFFGEYLSYLEMKDTAYIQQSIDYALTKSPYSELCLFRSLIFSSSSKIEENNNLVYEMEKNSSYANPFSMTAFTNPEFKIKQHHKLQTPAFKVGIHYHSYHMQLCQELLTYLRDFTIRFDLIVTVCKRCDIRIIECLFTKETIPSLDHLIVRCVENRGRDIAPWLVGTRDLQMNYDLLCHVQSKVSPHWEHGDDWRTYLFDNLIQKESVIDILNSFAQDESIGAIFPDMYPKLKEVVIRNNSPLLGCESEVACVHDLLKRMGFCPDVLRQELVFSAGTMLWYRPQALKPLFDLNLQVEDFPPEPIGVGGTIAHAIERLPALVCMRSGYQAKMYNKVCV